MLLLLISASLFLTYANSQNTCEKSITEANIENICSKQIIFEDDFENFRVKNWKHTIRISSPEDEEFIVYDKKPENIFIKNGKLLIKPTLLPDETVHSGAINLKMCTGRYETSDCYLQSTSYNILPPVESAQISSKNFNFKYGIVEIRAKLPSGDWIYPQLWLQPTFEDYGKLYNSGQIILASSRGNQELKTADGKDISNKVLKVGFVLGNGEKVFGKSALFENNAESWSEKFHNFTFVWKPDSLEAIVDGHRQELIKQGSPSIANEFKFTEVDKQVWSNSSPNAPFDKNFHLTIGLAVGGKREFPDESTTKNFHKKPWKNVGSVKRLLNFWRDRNDWYSTWTDEESALQVDYVKITAL